MLFERRTLPVHNISFVSKPRVSLDEWAYLLLGSQKHVTGVAVTNALILTSVPYAALSYLVIILKLFTAVELVHGRIPQSKKIYFHQRVQRGGR